MTITINAYEADLEKDWLKCRLISFFETDYYDDVIIEKPHYDGKSVELVALADNRVVGLLDAEMNEDEDVTYYDLHCIAVLPKFQGQGVGKLLFDKLIEETQKHDVKRIEVWTRENENANNWYLRQGFKQFMEYWHVWSESLPNDEVHELPASLNLKGAFWHYLGDNPETLNIKVYDKRRCRGYELLL